MRRRCFAYSLSLVTAALAISLTAPASLAAAPPTPVSPTGQARLTCPTFSWSEVEGAEGYELVVYAVDAEVGGEAVSEIEHVATVDHAPIVSRRLPAGTQSWTPSAEHCLRQGGSYAWSLRAIGADAGWSQAALFQVAAAPSIDDVERAIATLRRYMHQSRRGSEEQEGGSFSPMEAAVGAADRNRDGDSSSSGRGPGATSGAAGRDGQPPRRMASGRIVATAAPAAPAIGNASLTVSDQIHLDVDSDLFKDGNPFLWDDPAGNLALGNNALSSASGDATANTAVGVEALQSTVEGGSTFDGSRNTAIGSYALTSNTTGGFNTAIGYESLAFNTIGSGNIAIGDQAMSSNDGTNNTGIGDNALSSNDGDRNIGIGNSVLGYNAGDRNIAIGEDALRGRVLADLSIQRNTGSRNIAVGEKALQNNTTGLGNIAIGHKAGYELGYGVQQASTYMRNNVFIANEGQPDEEGTIRIGNESSHSRAFIAGIHGATLGGSNEQDVCVDDAGQLGPCPPSSARFKQEIEELGGETDRLLDLDPISFRYRPGMWGGPERVRVGLLAEEVAEIFPELVTRDGEGKPFGVRYELLSVLLLEKVQRQHEEMAALRERLGALEENRNGQGNHRSWWRRIFAGDSKPP